MLVYIDLEHERLQQVWPEEWGKSMARRLQHKYRFEGISGHPCLIIRYDRVTLELLHELRPQVKAVLVSGCYTDYEHYAPDSLAGLYAIFQEATWPTIGFCAGYQQMVQAYGGEINPIGPLPPGTPDPYQDRYVPGMQQERGFMPVQVTTPHPLFAHLSSQPTVFQAHYWEVKSLPEEFQVLAESEVTSIQAVAHSDRPLFGVQFHPEAYDEAHPHGRQIIENFFRIVGII